MLEIYELQRQIYGDTASYVREFATGGSLQVLFATIPMGVVFGAIHAMTPGHSKALLASYTVGTSDGLAKALGVSLLLATVHIGMAVAIAVFALPLVKTALGQVGQSPALETLSRSMLLLIGTTMIWRAWRDARGHQHEGLAMAIFAGVIPCPLTLFMMTLAISRGVPVAGLAFATAMLAGVVFTLSLVVLGAKVLRIQVLQLLHSHPTQIKMATRLLDGIAGLLMGLIAVHELLR